MKKLFLSLAVAAIALTPAASFAKTVVGTSVEESDFVEEINTVPANAAKTVKAVKNARPDNRVKGMKKGARRHDVRVRQNPFADLNLTDTQKAQLDTLNSQFASLRKEYKKEIANGYGATCRGLGKQARLEEQREYRDGLRDLNARYLVGIQQVLTPEQYTKFLENNFTARKMSKTKRFEEAKGYKAAEQAYSKEVGYPTVFRGQSVDNIAQIDQQLQREQSK